MSINPYKWILGLYSEEAMLSYHGKAAMVEAGELAPHLFGVADHAYSQLVSSMRESGYRYFASDIRQSCILCVCRQCGIYPRSCY